MRINEQTLFGDLPLKRTTKEIFEDYDGFVDKFKRKKTTDDCYTPPAVYDAVLDFVVRTWKIVPDKVIRPFFPDKNFTEEEYPEGCTVVDNPPFSIVTKICRWFCHRDIKFFLFCPGLTCLGIAPECDLTYIIINRSVVFENGADIAVGFVTNLPCEYRIWCCDELNRAIKEANRIAGLSHKKPKKSAKAFPDNVLVSGQLRRIVNEDYKVRKENAVFVKDLEGSKLFGGGYLISSRAAAERAAAERAAAERAAAGKAAAEKVELSQREIDMIEVLDRRSSDKVKCINQ